MNNLTQLKSLIKRTPVIGPLAKAVWSYAHTSKSFPGSSSYWEERYVKGGTSGAGSYSLLARFKADVVNSFVERNNISSVIEFGSGDGNQLKLAKYKAYIGFDVSEQAVKICQQNFENDQTKTFKNVNEYDNETADLAMSLDVVYHLVEDTVFDLYMRRLFGAAKKFVIIYSSNDASLNKKLGGYHVKHRKFTDWVKLNAPDWELKELLPNKYPYNEKKPENTSFADFYFYEKK